jgi:uncharacterized protein
MSMIWNAVSLRDCDPQPWKNGTGTTRELLAWPQNQKLQDWQIRLSVANIDGEATFSKFPGVERWFSVLQGRGVILSINDTAHAITPSSAALRFNGDENVHAKPLNCSASATVDFNLMLKNLKGFMQKVETVFNGPVAASRFIAIYSHDHSVTLSVDESAFNLHPQSLGWAITEKPISLTATGKTFHYVEVAL